MNHPTLKSLTLGIGLFFTLPLVYANSSFPSLSDGTLYINKSKTRKVAPVKYGFHYEEIGMMGEGALHAEPVSYTHLDVYKRQLICVVGYYR